MDEFLDECPCGGTYERIKVGREAMLGPRRRCTMCMTEQIWRMTQDATPENAPNLGEWRTAPKWVKDHADFWTDGTNPISKEEL